MCGCKKSVNTVQTQQSLTINENCTYTINQLTSYKDKLYCIKDKEIYNQVQSDEQTINRYLGITTSAIYYPSDLCYFEASLDEIKLFIENLDLTICNELSN